MSYHIASQRSVPPSGLGDYGCGPSCKCSGCSERFHGFAETFERDDDLGHSAYYGNYGADVEVTEPSGKTCRVGERRIHPVIEPTPDLLVPVPARYTAGGKKGVRLHHACFAAYQRLKQAAERDGIPPNILTIVSGYRSVAHQARLWEAALQKYGSPREARIWVAPPGGSPHHTGRAIDFNLGGPVSKSHVPALRRTAAYRWLVCNAASFGFTPYAAEPWHWEYNPAGFNPTAAPAERLV